MSFVHSKNTVIILAGNDLSEFSNTSDIEQTADEHDVTTYHPTRKSHVFQGGLLAGKATMGGVYDNGATGPRAVIQPLVGEVVELIYRPEGTGSGKPQDKVDALVKSYKESAPVADMRMWTCELTLSDDIDSTDQ